MKYGLIGENLGHSHAPKIYRAFGIPKYSLNEVAPTQLEEFIKSCEFDGLNVTIPYKKTVMPLCDELTDTAQKVGSVNCLRFDENRKITGHNTDYAGFLYMAKQAGISFTGKKVVILGTGGAAAAVLAAVKDEGAAQVVQISRGGEDNYNNLEKHADADILVNATPVGMSPDTNAAPLSLDAFPKLSGVLDLIYNPLRTKLILQAQAQAIASSGGFTMLIEQARAATEFFLNTKISQEENRRVTGETLKQIENIVLIGMPGCGKTVVGEIIADKAPRIFADTDKIIMQRSGMTSEHWIAAKGEASFREAEMKAISIAARDTGTVISTGGGTPLREVNRMVMRQTGRVYWLTRPNALLAVSGRPLSADLDQLLAARAPIYEETADVIIDAEHLTPEQVADKILEEFNAYIGS